MSKPMDSTKAWNINAEFWDARMGEGNVFHLKLVAPAVEKLLNIKPGQIVLDACCGNGQFSRRLTNLGAKVTAFDGAAKMVEIARNKSQAQPYTAIQYHVIDALDHPTMEALGQQQFDAVVCNMALMDILDIYSLLRAVHGLLKPNGIFVFAITHPCFNRPGMGWFDETIEVEGELVHRKGVKISQYITSHVAPMQAILGQPEKHYAFDRPLHYYIYASCCKRRICNKWYGRTNLYRSRTESDVKMASVSGNTSYFSMSLTEILKERIMRYPDYLKYGAVPDNTIKCYKVWNEKK